MRLKMWVPLPMNSQKGSVLLDVIIGLAVISILTVSFLDYYLDWVVEQKAIQVAAVADELMEATLDYYSEGKGNGIIPWPIRYVDIPTGLIDLVLLTWEDVLRPDFSDKTLGADYDFRVVNDGKIVKLVFIAPSSLTAKIIALHMKGITSSFGLVVTATRVRPLIHKNDHDKFLDRNARRELEGDMDFGGYGFKGLKRLLYADRERKNCGYLIAHPEDFGCFPHHEDIAISFAGSTTIIGRYTDSSGNPYKLTNTSTDTQENHVISLRTQAEWNSFARRVVPREPNLQLCVVTDLANETCDYVAPSVHAHIAPWTPSVYSFCTTNSFTQTAACGHTRPAYGATICTIEHVHIGPWSPDTNAVCSGEGFVQTASCGHTRPASGMKDCSTPPPSSGACTPDWQPSSFPSECRSKYSPQTDGCGNTRYMHGDIPLGTYAPRTNQKCAGELFTQTAICRPDLPATGILEAGPYGPPASGYCDDTTFTQHATCAISQVVSGTMDCGEPDDEEYDCEAEHDPDICGAYEDTYDREGEDDGADWWEQWLKDHPECPVGSECFQEAFEDGAQGEDKDHLAGEGDDGD